MSQKEALVVLTYEKQALSGTGQSYTALSKKMNYGRTVKFFGCQMKQGMDALQSIRFFLVLSFTITICTWDIAIKIKPQLKT